MGGGDRLLFIDESGDFDAEEPVWVAGILVADEEPARTGLTLRRAIEEALPHVGWPPHTAHLNVAAFHAVSFHARGESARPDDAAGLRAATVLLQKERAAEFDACGQRLGAGRRPELKQVRALDRFLRERDPAVAAALDAVRGRARAALQDVIRGFLASHGRCCVVGGADVPSTLAEENSEGDRYLAILAVLIERVVALLRGPVERRLRVFVAGRDVSVSDRRRPLHRDDVLDIGRAALSLPASAGEAASGLLHLDVQAPARYGSDVHAGIVIADFVANALWTRIASSTRWFLLNGAASATVGLSAEAAAASMPGAGPLPAIAGQGGSRRAIAAVLADRSASPRFVAHPGWNREQAGRWIAALRLAAGGRR